MKERQPNIDELLEKAELLESQGSLLEAMQVLLCALKLREDSSILLSLGSLAIDLERWTEAEEFLLSALKLDSNAPEVFAYLGLLYRAQGRLEAALKSFSTAARKEPSAAIFTLLGAAQGELDLTSEAKDSYRKAISIDPAHEEAYYNLATLLRDDAKDEAITLLERAIDINPNNAAAHRELGLLLRRSDQFPEAEYHLRRAIELDTTDGWAHIYLANMLWACRDFSSAEDAYKKAIEVWPDRGVPYWSFAHFQECQGEPAEAATLYKKALQIDPGDAQANWRFGSYLKDQGKYQEARHYLRSALELDPDDERPKVVLSEMEANHIET